MIYIKWNSMIETWLLVIMITKQAKIIPYASICFVCRTRLWGVVIDRLLYRRSASTILKSCAVKTRRDGEISKKISWSNFLVHILSTPSQILVHKVSSWVKIPESKSINLKVHCSCPLIAKEKTIVMDAVFQYLCQPRVL